MRLIDATRLRFEANRFFRNDIKLQDEVDFIICMMPTIDAVPVVHGEWGQPNRFKDGVGLWRCDQCGEASIRRFRYCPECGAKMDGGEDDA